MTKNIIICLLISIIGILTFIGIKELKTLHAAQAYIEALENDFPDYLDTTAENDVYLDYYERIR